MLVIIHLLLAVIYVILFVWFVNTVRKDRTFKDGGHADETFLLLLVIFGLFYDNFIIACGNWIGKGTLLKVLSYIRYSFHALFTPTLILFVWKICYTLQFRFFRKSWSKLLAYLLTFSLILYELFIVILKIKLEPINKYGLLTYEHAGNGNNIIVIIISVILGVVSILLIIRYKQFALFIGI